MKTKLLLLLLSTLFSVASFAQENKCSNYKNGTFKLHDKENNVSYLIERKGNKQYEQIIGQDLKIDFDVTWINDCTYTLHPSKKSIEVLKADFHLVVEIIEVKENSLILRMFAKETPNDVLTSEVEIVKS